MSCAVNDLYLSVFGMLDTPLVFTETARSVIHTILGNDVMEGKLRVYSLSIVMV